MTEIIDLHRHAGGSIRSEVVWSLLNNNDVAKNTDHVYDLMTYRNDVGVRSFYGFLGKFEILNKIKWSKLALASAFKSIVKDIRREGVRYCELRFSIDKYLQHINTNPIDIITIIKNTVKEVADYNGIVVKLILCLKYESNKEYQKKIMSLTDSIGDMVDGLDCVGDEHNFSADFYRPLFREWKQSGKMLTIHAGEIGSDAKNVISAIADLEVPRIGHGITVITDPYAISLAKERDICFEVSLSSNWYTGVVEDMAKHPVRKMVDCGLNVALCTDDPAIFGTTMNQELTIARMCLGFSDSEIELMKQNAIKYSIDRIYPKP